MTAPAHRQRIRVLPGRLPALVGGFIALALVAGLIPNVFAAPPAPTLTLSVPATPLVGSSVQITATFSNPSDTGYGPFIDLVLPQQGADGAIAPPNNGVTFTSATFLGSPVPSSVQTIPVGGCVTEPYAYQASGAHAILCGLPVGEQFVSLQLPFGSFTSAQPQAAVVITAAVSNRARVGSALAISAHGGFTYGADALQNPASDPTISGSTVSGSVTPTVLSVSGAFIAPETETATGPEFPRQYRVDVSVAPGQVLTNLDLTADLPANLQFVSFGSSVPASSAIATPSTSSPDGVLTRRFASVTGTGGVDASFIFTFNVPRLDAASGAVINAASGGAVTSRIDNTATGTWTPIDFPRQPATSPSATSSATLTDRSIAIQSSVAITTDTSPAGLSPNDGLTWALPFQVSDFFAFKDVVVDDVLRDGTTFGASPVPTISLSGNGFSIVNQTIEPAYYTAALQADGTTAIQFNVSAWLVAHGFGANIVGGCVLPTGSAPDCVAHANGAVTGMITFRSVVDASFHVPQAGHDQFIDQGDIISDAASISGTVLVDTTLASTGNTAADGNASTSSPGTTTQGQIAVGALSKTIYAINGVVGPSAHIRAGDVVTYRLVQTMPISTAETYSLSDYLPLPIFKATTVTTFNPVVSAATPPSGTAKFGPTDSFSAYVGINPTISSDAAGNSVTFTYGNVQAALNTTQTDLLFSVTVATDPFADGLSLTNQVQSVQGSTNASTTLSTAIVAVTLDEPQITAVSKGAIASTNPLATFTPATVLPAGVTVSAPGSACPRLTGAVTSAGIATTPITSDIANVQATDRTTFAIAIENTGHAAAYDVKVNDLIPAGYQAPAGGINLCVRRGDGAALTFTGSAATFVTAAGITLDDGATGALLAGVNGAGVVNATGSNIAVITYDLTVSPTVNPLNVIANTASLASYSSSDGGPNFIPAGLTDQALTTIAAPTIAKTLTTTSLANTAGNSVVIGEVATFATVLTVPAGTMPAVIVSDVLPANLAFVGCTSVVSSSAQLTSSIGAFTVACNAPTDPTVGPNGTPATFSLGTLTNASGAAQTVTLTYRAVATNVAANVSGVNLVSPASVTYTNAVGPQSATSLSVGVAVVEPLLAITTTSAPATGEAGTVIAYTTTVSKGTSTADGFDASVSLPLPAGMTFVPASMTCTGQVTTSCAFVGNTGTVTWSTFANTAATTIIKYSATLDATVTPSTAYILTTPLTWSSLPGAPGQISPFNALSFERTGVVTDPGLAANTYRASASRTVTTAAPVPTKSLVTSSEAASTGNSLLVGEVVRYRLVTTIPAGSSPNAAITDLLPANLQFINDGTARIAFVSNGAGMTTTDGPLTGCAGLNVSGTATTLAALPAASVVCVIPAGNIGGAPFAAGTDPVFTLGSITNKDRDADVESVVIDLNAVVANVAANANGTVINNQAQITDNGVNVASANFAQTVINPTVTVVKSIITAPSQAGSNAVYQVVVTNTSAFSTFDARLLDVLPASLIVDSHAVTVGAAADTDASAGNTVDLTWNTLAAGQSMTIRITAHVDPLAASGLTIANTATMTWTSLPGTGGTIGNPTGSNTPGASGSATGERTGVGGAPNSLTAASTVSTTLNGPSIVKTGGPATIAVGDTLTFNLVTTLAEGTTRALVVTDGLPNGLTYTGSTVITSAAASGGLLTADFGGTLAVPAIVAPANGGPVTFTFGNTVNPADANAANDRFLVRVTVRVRNIAGNVRGIVLSNPASVSYTNPNTLATATANAPTPATSTVIEPKLDLTHTVSVPAARNEAGAIVTYQVLVNADVLSNATAYDAALTTTIPAGMTYVPASLVCSSGTITPATCSVVGQVLSATWATFPTGAGTTVITYQAKYNNTVNPSQVLTNTSALTWKSLPTDATNANIRTGANGVGGSPNNYAAASQVATTILAQAIAKSLAATSEASTTGSNLAIGETATYTLSVSLPEGTTPSLTILDDLPVGMSYVAGSAVVSAAGFNGTLPVATVTAPGGSGADVTLAFGSITVVADGIVPNDTFTITLQAKVLDIAANVAGQVRANSATATVGAGTPVASNVVNATVVEPHLVSSLVPSTASPTFGTPVTYTYTLSHSASTSDADDVVVTVTIPATIVYTPGSAVAPAGWTVDETGLPSTVRFTRSVLTQVTGSAAFTWVAVTPGVGGTTIGTASLTSAIATWTSLAGAVAGERTGAGGIDNYVTNASASVTLSSVDLTITSMSDGGITATPGSLVPYVISYRNDGNVSATGIVLTATVPANSTFDTAGSSAGWSCANGAPGGSVCTLSLPALAASGTGTRTFAVRPVTPWAVGVPKVINATSSIADDGTHGPDPTANNSGADSTPITASPDLTTTITDGKPGTLAGAPNDYAITVDNVGHQNAAGVVVAMTVPAHTTFNPGASTAGWVCVGTACTFPLGALAGNGGSSIVHFVVTVDDPIGANVASIAGTDTVSDDGTGGADPTPANNSATDTDTIPLIDLSVALAGGLAHQGIPYVITATIANAGPAGATGVTTHIALPPSLTYVSDDGAGAYAGGSGTWTVGALASGANRTLHITVMPTAVGAPVVATEVTDALQSDVDSTPANGSTTEDDDDTLTVTVAPTADLGITKTVDRPNVEVGDSVVFTVAVHNAGPNGATGVTVADLLPAGLAYVSDDAAGAYNAGTGAWTIGSLASGSTATLHVTATIGVLGTRTNTATVAAATFDPAAGDNSASVSVHARSSDIAVTKVRVGPVPNYLDTVTYKITATNLGPDASTVSVTDLLPASLAYLSDDAAGAYNPLTGVWTVGNLALGDSSVLTVTARVVATGTTSNTATVSHEDHLDPNLANNSATSTMTVAPGVDDSVTIGASDTTPLFHQTITLTVTAHNEGPDTAANSVVSAALPAGLTYVSDDGAGGYVPGTGVWTLGGLAAGQTRVLHIVATTVATGSIVVPATIATTTFDHDLSNNADSVSLTVPKSSDLSITKTVDNAAPHDTENVTFTITVHNAGPDSATGQVDDLLPAGLSYVSDDSAGGAYDPVTGKLAFGSLPSGASFTVHVTAKTTAAGPITNTATVSGPQHDENLANNTASATIVVIAAADLAATIAPSDATPNVGDLETLTITAHDIGPDNAQNTVLTALLPAGLTYAGDDAGGAYDAATGAWTLGTLGTGTTATLHVTATVTVPGTIVIPVSVTSTTFDPVLPNNSDATTLTVPSADLSITKSASDTTPNYLATTTFTITVHNAGPDTAKGVVVGDLLPIGLTWVSDDGAGDYVHATGIWTVGTIANGGSAVLHVTARATATGTVVNHATVSADTFDPALANNDASRSIDVAPAADITAAIIVSDPTPNVGQAITYTVTIHNAGPDDAVTASAAIVLPAALTYLSDDAAGAYVPATGHLAIGNLAAGSSFVLVLQAKPNAPGSMAQHVTATSATFDQNLANNHAAVTIVVPTADLVVQKSVSDATPDYLHTTTFKITVHNAGPDAAANVVLSDPLPAGLTYVSDDSGGSYDPATGAWSIGALANGDTVTLHITVRATSTGVHVNTATVSADTFDPSSGNDKDSATVTVAPAGDVSITKTVDNLTPNVGDVVTFTITVHNAGPDAATGVSVADEIPAGLAYLSDDGAGAYDVPTTVWTIGSLAAGDDTVLHVSATVIASGTFPNTATVSSTSYDQDLSNNVASTAPAAPKAADLKVTDAVSDSTPSLHDVVAYTVVVSNNGPDTGTNVGVVFPIPAGFTYVSDDGSGAYDPGTGVWTIGSLAKGDTETLVVHARVIVNGTLTTTAIVAGSLYDPAPANNIDSASLTVLTADLGIVKTVDQATPNYLDTVVYTVVVTNHGPSAASGVSVSDHLPAGLTWVSDDAGGDYVHGTGIWAVGALANGASATLHVTARVTATGTRANTATIGSLEQVDPNSANDSDQAVITVADAADIEVKVTGSTASPNVGQPVTVHVKVINHGPDAASNVVLHDVFPSVLVYVADDGAGAYDSATGIWTIGSIPAAGSVTLAISGTAATVGASSDVASAVTSTYEANLTNNHDAWALTVAPTADLSLTKTADAPIPHDGTNVTYTITVHNAGPDTATGVKVADLLPAGLAYVSDDAAGDYSSGTGIWSIGSIADGADAVLHLTARVVTTGPIANTGEIVASGEFDPNSTPGNGEPLEDDQATATVNGQAAADLSVSNTVSVLTGDAGGSIMVPSVNLGGTVRFTISTANAGPDDATGVTTHVKLPAGLAWLSDDAPGTYDPTSGTWTIGSLAKGTSTTLHVTARVIATGGASVTAELMTAFEWDPDSTPGNHAASEDDQAAATLTVPAAASLSLTKTASVAKVERGAEVTFTLTVHNDGPDGATNVRVLDALPAGMTFVSSDGGSAFDPATMTWSIAHLANGDSASLHLVVKVNRVGTLENVARVTGSDQFDPTFGIAGAVARASVKAVAAPGDGLPNTNLDPSSPLVVGGLALLAALSFLAAGVLRRRSRRASHAGR